MSVIRKALEVLSIGPAVESGRLTMYPLIRDDLIEPFYLTLNQALDLDVIQITEVSQSGRVPELMVTNRGKQPVFLLDGEELRGAKQNRVLNVSILVPGNCKVVVPVSCVEEGRWSQQSKHFTAADHTMPARMRMTKAKQVSHSLSCEGSRRSDQSALWKDVSDRLCELKVNSPTHAINAVYQEKRVDINEIVNQMGPFESQIGAVFAIDGLIVGMELFDSQGTLQHLLPKITRSYAVETLTSGIQVRPLKPEDPGDFLKAVGSSAVQTFESPGLGQELRLKGEGVIGSAIIYEDVLIHLNAFRTQGEECRNSASDPGRMTPLGHRRRNRSAGTN